MTRPALWVAWMALTVSWAALPTSANSSDPPIELDFDAKIFFEWATDLHSGDAQKLETRLEPELEISLPWDLRLTALGRLRADAFDRMWRDDVQAVEVSSLSRPRLIGNQAEVELREFYLEGRFGEILYTIGKQQVVWGQADGLKVLDVVNPQSFREFILEEFEDSRIPLWTVAVEIPIGDVVAQLLWIPDPSGHALPPDGSVFTFRAKGLAPQKTPGVVLNVREVERPTSFYNDSDAGLRLQTFFKGWDLTLNYLYHYEDFAVPFRRIAFPGGVPTVTISPEFRRSHLLGGTFSNAFGDLTVRGEAGYTVGRFYPTELLSDSNGVVRVDELAYVLGFDWYGFDETVLSAQIFHSVVTGRASSLIRDQQDAFATLLFQRDFANDRLQISNLWLHNLRQSDGMLRPKVSYEVRTGLNVWLGLDWFYGRRNGFFGQFDGRDRALVGIEYGF